jgi:hypothetical protein
MYNAEIYSAEPSSAKPDVLESESEGFGISRSLDDLGETAIVEPEDWRTPIVCYLENPGHVTDRKVQRQALKTVCLIMTFIDEL